MKGTLDRYIAFGRNFFGPKPEVGFRVARHGNLPTCSEALRGVEYRVEGAAGVNDVSYVCMKDSANAYGWETSVLPGGVYTDEQARDAIGAALVAGNNIDITVNDGANTITIDVESLTSTDLSDFTEAAQDAVGGALIDSSTIDFTYTDGSNQITAAVIPGGISHNSLSGLTTGDPHTQYALDTDLTAGLATKQPLDADLTTLAANITAAGHALVDDATAGDQRTTLGLVAGGAGDIWVEKAGDTMTGSLGVGVAASAKLHVAHTTAPVLAIQRASNDAGGVRFDFEKTRNPTPGAHTAVVADDQLLNISARGSDGTNFVEAAKIRVLVDTGTVGTNDIPGKMLLETSPDGTVTTVERVSIYNNGLVVLNETGTDSDFRVEGDTDVNLLFTDASTDRVGVGTATPSAKLHVNGAAQVDGTLTLSAQNIATDTTTGLKIGTATTQKLGFFNATPIVRGTAFTQTFSTASHTVPAATQLAAPAGGTGTAAGGWDTAANRNLAITSINAARTDIDALKQVVNGLIDDLQALGLIG